MPAHLAATKWPASWTNTRTPRTTIRDRTVVSTMPSRTAYVVAGALARPAIGLADGRQAARGSRSVLIEHPLDGLADAPERDLSRQKRRDRGLVRRVVHRRRD